MQVGKKRRLVFTEYVYVRIEQNSRERTQTQKLIICVTEKDHNILLREAGHVRA